MPNLHNVGEGIYGGVMQTPVEIVVGAASGAHSVIHPKYKDVLKSFVKEKKGGTVYHDQAPRCLNKFDKNLHDILSQQKSLPPDKHNNILFAEQLTLKLNVAASDSEIFPQGLGDLIYDNHQLDPTPLDSLPIRQMVVVVDQYLSCDPNSNSAHLDPSQLLRVIQNINSAFSGPMDTTSWSCGKVICPGVKMLSEVPYLRHNPSAVPRIDFSRGPVVPYTQQPSVFALSQNYPNPFNPTTTIEFELKEEARVTLKVFNTLGQEVAELIHNELMDEGMQDVEFDASSLSSGVYYYRIIAADAEDNAVLYSSVKKMLLVK